MYVINVMNRCLQNGLHPSGPIRPMPLVPSANLVETKNLSPAYLGLGAAAVAAHAPNLLHIQMAIAAQRQAAEQGFPQTAPFRHAPPPQGYPLYPWLMSRHGRMYPPFPGSEYTNQNLSFIINAIFQKKKKNIFASFIIEFVL